MAKYRKRLFVIDAMQWTGSNKDEIATWRDSFDPEVKEISQWLFHGGVLRLPLPGGMSEAMPGEWIIRNEVGFFYPCTEKEFEAIYEQAPARTDIARAVVEAVSQPAGLSELQATIEAALATFGVGA